MYQKTLQNFNWKSIFLDTSTLVLIFSNFITIVLAVIQHWSMATIVCTYWLQSIIIGIFNVVRILTLDKFSTNGLKYNGKPVEANSKQGKRSAGFFFLIHYGCFHFIYALFLWESFKDINIKYLAIGGIIFFCNHLFSYIHNRYEDQISVPNLGHIMFGPYIRIIPMHLIILFFGWAIQSTGALVVFLLLKSTMDVLMHIIKHLLNKN
jgi:hypothetical protein